MSVTTVAGILAQTPAGALIDSTKAKRTVMVAAAVLVTAASLLLPWLSSFFSVAASQATAHAASAVFGPALTAVTLGIFGHRAFAGNACAAAAAGSAAYFWGPSVVFYLLAAMSIASMASVIAIPGRAINHDLARGLHDRGPGGRGASGTSAAPSGLTVLMTCKPLLVFAIAVVLFHLANAAMLPLIGQKLALQNTNLGTSLMSVCIVAAQVVMVPMAMLVGARADKLGAKAALPRCLPHPGASRHSLHAFR